MLGIRQFWPLGSGLGTFPVIYPLFENSQYLTPTYVNHAHNDYLEFVFETGLIGAGLITLFVAWWVWRSIAVWRAERTVGATWQRAASIVIGVMILHSIVDYPLRTPAILVMFAFYALVLGCDAGPPTRDARADRPGRGRRADLADGDLGYQHRPGGLVSGTNL